MPFNNDNPLKMPLFKFDLLSNFPEVKHGISTRHSPVNPIWPEVQPEKPDDYKMGGSNLGIADEIILKRRAEFLVACGGNWQTQMDNMTSGYQQHTANVAVVDSRPYGAKLNWKHSIPDTDALVTNLPGIPMITGHADCAPVLFYEPEKRVVAIAHSGWKGTVTKISAETVKVMVREYNCSPTKIIACIGPSIGPCCYEVDEPVLKLVLSSFGSAAGNLILEKPSGSTVFDVWGAIRHTLQESGIQSSNIEESAICTLCHKETFFSYRGAAPGIKGRQGNFGAMIMLDY